MWSNAPTLHSSAYYSFYIQEVPDSDIAFKTTFEFSWLKFMNIVMFVKFLHGIFLFFPGLRMMSEGESDQFSLRWNNFHSNLTSGFHALLQGEDLVDVTLAAGGQFVQAHKIVLSVCSPYFKDLFKVCCGLQSILMDHD